MSILEGNLGRLEIGPARTWAGLTVYPLSADRNKTIGELRYSTLDEALAAGTARVTEVSQAGSVPDLCFVNDGDRPVLLLDGEELLGAKQNRVLNLTILVPPRETVVIPVSCVEAGRWHAESTSFVGSAQVMYSKGRAFKAAQVSRSMRERRERRSDQGAVWNEIAKLSERHGVVSRTGKMADVFASRKRQIDDYVNAFSTRPDQVGAAFALRGRVCGIEVFDHPRTMSSLLPKLVRSWALDDLDLDDKTGDVPPDDAVRRFLREVGSAEASEHDAVGWGTEVRLRGTHLAGGALIHDEAIVHLCAFRVEGEQADPGTPRLRSRILRASWRSRRTN